VFLWCQLWQEQGGWRRRGRWGEEAGEDGDRRSSRRRRRRRRRWRRRRSSADVEEEEEGILGSHTEASGARRWGVCANNAHNAVCHWCDCTDSPNHSLTLVR